MVKKHPFTKEQAAYLSYIQRWKGTGEGATKPCCAVHKGTEPTVRVRFIDFCDKLRELSEVEFYIIALKNDDKTRGGAYPKLRRQQRELRELLLITDIEEEDYEEEEEEKKVKDADDVPTEVLLEEATEIEDALQQQRDERIRREKGGGMAAV